MSPGVVVPMEAADTQKPSHPDSELSASTPSQQQQWTPETVISSLAQRPTIHSNSPLPFFHMLERLKTTKREGWRRFNIDDGESISDHMYRMSIITMLCPPALAARLDLARCTRMALIHDMAESLVGDITPVDGVTKAEKSRRETETMDYLCDGLLGRVHGGGAGDELRKVWQEYEDDETDEAHFVHDVDKMELLLQMVEYERSRRGQINLGEFSHVAARIKLPEVQAWAAEVLEERRAFWDEVRETGAAGVQANDGLDRSEQMKRQQDEYYARAAASDKAE